MRFPRIRLTSQTTLLVLLLSTTLVGCGGNAVAATTVPTTAATTVIPTIVTSGPTQVVQQPSRTPLPSLTPSEASKAPAGQTNTATSATQAAPGPIDAAVTQQASATSALLAASTATSVTPLPTQAAVLPGGAPPFAIIVPEDWQVAYAILPTRDLYSQQSMNMAVYRGPVKGGKATIVALWGFPSLGPPPTLSAAAMLTAIPGTPSDDLQNQILWADGLRLLQGTIVGVTCNVAHYGQRPLTIGGLPAIGESFNSAQCQGGEPDTYGWFAGLHQNGSNFLFYIYIEPIEAYNGARFEMQQILDTVKFQLPGQASTTPGTPSNPPSTNTSQPTTTPILQ